MRSWPAALDALDAWVRRSADSLAGQAQPPVAPRMPPGPVPPELRLRATLLLAAMRDLEIELLKRREQLGRERAYTTV